VGPSVERQGPRSLWGKASRAAVRRAKRLQGFEDSKEKGSRIRGFQDSSENDENT
jgi:hypothetical protein